MVALQVPKATQANNKRDLLQAASLEFIILINIHA